MIATKSIPFRRMMSISGHHVVWLLAMTSTFAALYHFELIRFHIPWLPMSVIGTAVAFYVGFKNNQAYDRLWEARKIWGGMVNDSRTWGMMVDGYVSNLNADAPVSDHELKSIKRRLIYRHIGWLYAHRSQLLAPTEWEHISQGGNLARFARRYQRLFGVGLVEDEVTRIELKHYLPADEHNALIAAVNTATQTINAQSRDLRALRERGLLDCFRHTQMVGVLQSFYALQGKNERIKKFPLPRQYANMSRYFVGIFVALLPFSMIPELQDLGGWGIWLSIPITALIGWVYVMMEVVGDYTENPFQGMANDIPMLSLCRTIEIDMRQMLGETDLPDPIRSKNGVLM